MFLGLATFVYKWDVLHYLPVHQRIHYRIPSIIWHCILDLFICRNSTSYFVLVLSMISPLGLQRRLSFLHCQQTEYCFLDCGSLCLTLKSETLASPLTSVLSQRTGLALINCSKLSSLTGPGFGAPLNCCHCYTYNQMLVIKYS